MVEWKNKFFTMISVTNLKQLYVFHGKTVRQVNGLLMQKLLDRVVEIVQQLAKLKNMQIYNWLQYCATKVREGFQDLKFSGVEN